MDKTETREIVTQKIEIREDENGNRTLIGYAVKWEKKSLVMGYYRKFREQFKNGAFTETLRNDDQRFLWSHDTSKVLGRTKNNTLRLSEDAVGLRFELDLPNTTLGNDTYVSIKRGDVDGVSFGFSMISEEIQEPDDDLMLRTVTKAKLLEVSAVAFPAYPDSEVSARGYDPYRNYVQEKEKTELRKRLILKTYL
ncbi:HK97 family phage prohead protease [Bacillus paranthracis]|uniref:HK97 family phage prohead protease n=1 Tax=Bacillus cereus group TaxID=86661 RepID=UPI001E3A40A8|nr:MULTISPECIES: HK97 family phage prohead protease [Bacillus cereus group]MCC2429875.1 HK97 family phage prohead protease [Bacillus paranthracis]MCU5390503.1 HK97 family phage prohead protease [Bacillus paranthracis]MDA1620158.1 HK97 family phage prohead protease [Bacillus cereus group sp. TH204-1LC]MDK7476339.1 HK97 family phage prohead protease [Bacillus paranthracis]